jgi:diguanylate cyclase (GGDEF)-like protein
MVVAEMSRQMRTGDLIARLGGDEFVMLLPESGAPEAAKVAERICAAVTAAATEAVGTTFTTTVSVGVAQWITDETLGELLARADAALYTAKSESHQKDTQAPV